MKKNSKKKFLTGVPPWIFIGALAILFPIFAFVTIQNIHRQNENNVRLLLEKGAALIRSFEAGTRTGMGLRWNERQLQKLLTETAQQPDIAYLLVTDINGRILAHNNPGYIGQIHGKALNLAAIPMLDAVQWHIVTDLRARKIFEVYRKFSPGGKDMEPGHMMMRMWFGRGMHEEMDIISSGLIIFVGLDMKTIEEANRADIRHTVIMGIILLFIGFAGVMLLLMAQNYRAARISLSRIKAFSDNIVEYMPIGLIALDDNKNITSLNNVAGLVLNLSGTTIIGENADNVLPRDIVRIIDGLDRKKGVIEKEMDCTISGKKIIPLEISSTVLNDENGIFLGYVILFKDLSEVRSLRKEIARSQRLASVGRLAAGVSHEIRNPLSSIKGFATYFKERYRDVPEDQHIADIMIQEVDRLNRVVSQLHEFARPVKINKKQIQIKDLIEDSIKLIERQAKNADIKISTRFSSGTEFVFIDRDRINQVLINLYLNAVESMESGGILGVFIKRNDTEKMVDIKITDTGSGISDSDLGHIFDPYFTTKASGTGLGLAIIHNIIEAHGGKIKVDSRYGEGTTVTVLLPFA